MQSRVRNDLFDRNLNFVRGRSFFVYAVWLAIRWMCFSTAFPWPSIVKVHLLRIFGAKIGKSVVLKQSVLIQFPWKLEIGDHCWIGEDVLIINFDVVTIGNHCCVSQRACLCSGNHNFRSRDMCYRNSPIRLNDGAWIGAMAFVGPGVNVGMDTVVCAGAVLTSSCDENAIYSGNPATKTSNRWKSELVV